MILLARSVWLAPAAVPNPMIVSLTIDVPAIYTSRVPLYAVSNVFTGRSAVEQRPRGMVLRGLIPRSARNGGRYWTYDHVHRARGPGSVHQWGGLRGRDGLLTAGVIVSGVFSVVAGALQLKSRSPSRSTRRRPTPRPLPCE